ncbi:MAG TPA: twin-arginine translocase TatA/TatE family subunit [Rubrobacteraceae bacterium]|jgi:sec-independent protein translocase protein TatA|nr:twin-arginine translocase TatA/TatE family subunit [Rubrobacteraceae bacterium]
MSLGLIEILLVFLVFMIMGPKRIANLFRSLGRGVHDFVESLGRDKKEELEVEPDDRERGE